MSQQPEKQPEIPGLEPREPSQLTDDDWLTKWIELGELFSPTKPVKEADMFAGRGDQLRALIHAIFQSGQHIVVYGERGVGKTSLLNTVTKKIFPLSSRYKFFSAQCYEGDDFIKIWERVFSEHKWEDGHFAADDIDSSLDSDLLLSIANKFSPTVSPVFVFDEFDRIDDQDTKKRMAETIKLFSDKSDEATIVVVGVGRTIRDLFAEHDSVRRAIKQVGMPRMSSGEIRDVVNVRLAKAGMTIEPKALDFIEKLSNGMPGYAHVLGLNSARKATDRKKFEINSDDTFDSLDSCLEDVGESIRQAYSKATQSAQPGNYLKRALLACALAPNDDAHSFAAADLRKPISQVMQREWDIPDYARYLKAFCSKERGRILERDGNPKNYRYRFADAMMRPYIIMQGYKENLLKPNDPN